LCRRCFQWAIYVGCTPYELASSFTVWSPLRASRATRALHAALACCRCVDIGWLLWDAVDTAFYLNALSSFRGPLYPLVWTCSPRNRLR
jgi:hypothetical protein